jgi:hypothetical protein
LLLKIAYDILNISKKDREQEEYNTNGDRKFVVDGNEYQLELEGSLGV